MSRGRGLRGTERAAFLILNVPHSEREATLRMGHYPPQQQESPELHSAALVARQSGLLAF